MHFFEVGVPVEGRVAAEEEVGYYSYGPDVAVGGGRLAWEFGGERREGGRERGVLGVGERVSGEGCCFWGRVKEGFIHRFPMPALLEYLRRHVARCAAGGGEDVEGLIVHDTGEAEVGDEEVGVVFRGAEQEVFGLEIPVDDAVVVQVGDGGEGGADQVRCVGFVVVAFAADAVEELAAEGEVGYKVDCLGGRWVSWLDFELMVRGGWGEERMRMRMGWGELAYGCSWSRSSRRG